MSAFVRELLGAAALTGTTETPNKQIETKMLVVVFIDFRLCIVHFRWLPARQGDRSLPI